MKITLEEVVTEEYGPRCPDFDPDCMTCQLWAELDILADARSRSGTRGAAAGDETSVAGLPEDLRLRLAAGIEQKVSDISRAVFARGGSTPATRSASSAINESFQRWARDVRNGTGQI